MMSAYDTMKISNSNQETKLCELIDSGPARGFESLLSPLNIPPAVIRGLLIGVWDA